MRCCMGYERRKLPPATRRAWAASSSTTYSPRQTMPSATFPLRGMEYSATHADQSAALRDQPGEAASRFVAPALNSDVLPLHFGCFPTSDGKLHPVRALDSRDNMPPCVGSSQKSRLGHGGGVVV